MLDVHFPIRVKTGSLSTSKSRQYYLANADKLKRQRMENYKKNKTYNKKYQMWRRHTDKFYALEQSVRSICYRVGIKPCKENLGCSFKDLMSRILKNAPKGCTAKNYRVKWFIGRKDSRSVHYSTFYARLYRV